MFSDLQQISNMFIRPQRYKYSSVDLGANKFQLAGKIVYRIDLQIQNTNHILLKCSIFSNTKLISQIKKAIIYLHCNSGCRIQGLTYLKNAIMQDYALVVFDFSGSGISGGQYVSLGIKFYKNRKGFHETSDVQCIVKYLKSHNSKIILCIWGRSMGAVAALRYIQKDPSIRVGVFDSPFSSLRQLALEIGKQQTKFPKILIELFLEYLKPTIEKKANFNIDQLNLKNNIEKIKVAGIFLGSKNDKLVPFSQVQSLFDLYKQKKQLFLIDEEHNETRKKQTLQKVFRSINKYMRMRRQDYKIYLNTESKQNIQRKKLELTSKSISSKNIMTLKSINFIKIQQNNKNKKKSCQNLKSIGPKIMISQLVSKEKYLNSEGSQKNQQIIQKQNILLKTTTSPKFKSKTIKDQIMKGISDQIFYRKVLKKQSIKNTQQNQLQKNRKTVHHLLKSAEPEQNQDKKFKRISFTRTRKNFNQQNQKK